MTNVEARSRRVRKAAGPLLALELLGQASAQAPLQDRSGAGQSIVASSASLKGEAQLRLKQDRSRTCERNEVDVLPVTERSKFWITHHFSDDQHGYLNRIALERAFKARPADIPLLKTRCDELGKFEFSGLEPGSYYVIARIYWSQRWAWLGGGVLAKVSLAKDERASIRLEADAE